MLLKNFFVEFGVVGGAGLGVGFALVSGVGREGLFARRGCLWC